LVLDVHIVILPLYLVELLAQLVNTLIVVVLIPPVPPGLPPTNMRAIVRNNPAVVIFLSILLKPAVLERQIETRLATIYFEAE